MLAGESDPNLSFLDRVVDDGCSRRCFHVVQRFSA
jgi:hypothetical protein